MQRWDGSGCGFKGVAQPCVHGGAGDNLSVFVWGFQSHAWRRERRAGGAGGAVGESGDTADRAAPLCLH